ncbi:hypothetical protein TNCV_873761 [Trichonephila clavipes]|nr:hypothetical protein TNCV_873761 [Trichonephila clavipes]
MFYDPQDIFSTVPVYPLGVWGSVLRRFRFLPPLNNPHFTDSLQLHKHQPPFYGPYHKWTLPFTTPPKKSAYIGGGRERADEGEGTPETVQAWEWFPAASKHNEIGLILNYALNGMVVG